VTPGDAARVLAACALFDNRKIPDDENGDRLAEGWFALIGHLDLRDALEAVRRHYAESTEWIMPAHINRGVRAIKAERRRDMHHEARQLPSPFERDVTKAVTGTRGAATVREVLVPLLERLAQDTDAKNAVSALDRLRAITAEPKTEDETTKGDQE